jgi:hypothetical protein
MEETEVKIETGAKKKHSRLALELERIYIRVYQVVYTSFGAQFM